MSCRAFRWSLAAAAVTLVLGLLAPVRAEVPGDYPFLRYDEALRAAAAEGRPVFVYFSRQGCSSCRKINHETFTDPRLRQRLLDGYVLSAVDTESGTRITLPSGERTTEMQLAAALRVVGTPTFFILLPDGTPAAVTAGFRTVDEMLAFDAWFAGGHYRRQTFREYLDSVSS
jgi:thioredoxin-related protein